MRRKGGTGLVANEMRVLAASLRLAVEGAGRRVLIEWREGGVPMAGDAPPRRKGYGTELIERALPYQLGAETRLEFGADGVRCAIVVPVETRRAGTRHG